MMFAYRCDSKLALSSTKQASYHRGSSRCRDCRISEEERKAPPLCCEFRAALAQRHASKAASVAASVSRARATTAEEDQLDVGAFAAAQAKQNVAEGLAAARLNALNVIKKCVTRGDGRSLIKNAVSGNKRRFIDREAKLDLDLTYVTPRIIAMGIPSVGLEAAYRNDLEDVQRFFTSRHQSPAAEGAPPAPQWCCARVASSL